MGKGWSAGPTYGVSVGQVNRDLHFDRSWRTVRLTLGDEPRPIEIPITDAFWHKCPEFRHPAIRDWYTRLGLAPWPKGQPPSFKVRQIEGNHFSVEPIVRKSLI